MLHAGVSGEGTRRKRRGATPTTGEESERVRLADPVPNVVSTELRPEEGPRVRQCGWLSSSEIWRPQPVQLVHTCQCVRNQSLETPGGLAAASTWMPGSLPALGPGPDSGRVVEVPLLQRPVILRCACSPVTCRVQRFSGPWVPVPLVTPGRGSHLACAHLSVFMYVCPDALWDSRLPPAATGASAGARVEGSVELGEAEEDGRQFPRQPGCQEAGTQHQGRLSLVTK